MHSNNCKTLLAFLVSLTLLLALAAPATAGNGADGLPPQVEDHVLALAYTHRVAAGEIQPVMATLSEAARRGFPLGPFVQKIEEGLGKRVPPARIDAALHAMSARFEHFGALLDRLPPDARRNRERLMERMNELAVMGIDSQEIMSRLGAPTAPPAEQVLNALETKAALRNVGVPPEAIEQLLNAGLAAGYFQQPGLEVARMARAARDKGVSMDQISRVSMEVVAGATNARNAARQLGLDDAQTNAGHGQRNGAARGSDADGGVGNGDGGGNGGGSSGGGGNGGGGNGGGGNGGGNGGGGRK